MRVAGGWPAALLLIAYAMVLALVIGGFAAMLALRTGSAEAVQNVFPLTFIGLFISSAFFPTEVMHGVYQSIAERNPITWMIDGMRHQVIVGPRLEPGRSCRSPSPPCLAVIAIFGAHRALLARLRQGSMTAPAVTGHRTTSWVPVALGARAAQPGRHPAHPGGGRPAGGHADVLRHRVLRVVRGR